MKEIHQVNVPGRVEISGMPGPDNEDPAISHARTLVSGPDTPARTGEQSAPEHTCDIASFLSADEVKTAVLVATLAITDGLKVHDYAERKQEYKRGLDILRTSVVSLSLSV